MAYVTVFAVAVGLVRVEGCSGDNHPIFAWRWQRKEQPKLVPLETKGIEVDLTRTTPGDSPQFLGPDRDNQVPGIKLARDWEAHPPKEVWRHPIGAGWSSFAVVGDFAVTLEQRDDREVVVCYRKSTGETCWVHDDGETFISVIGGDGPRSTPTIDEGRVYTFGVMGRLSCLDGATGKALWSHPLLDRQAENFSKIYPEWGKSCSPLVVGNLVIVSRGLPDGHSLEAYDKLTGKRAWHAGDAPSAYTSPVLATLDGKQQIVVVDRESVEGYDLDGAPLWSFEWKGAEPKVPQPVAIAPDRLFISAGYGVGAKLLKLDQGDGGWKIEELWSKRTLKPKFTNVVVRDPIAYALDDGTALTCIDLATGNRKWRGGRYGHGQILQAGDLLLVLAENGELALVDATADSGKELGRVTIFADKTWNEPTLAGKYLLMRNDREAACYELPLE
jgi:outer membrane protein assembly factor BamB